MWGAGVVDSVAGQVVEVLAKLMATGLWADAKNAVVYWCYEHDEAQAGELGADLDWLHTEIADGGTGKGPCEALEGHLQRVPAKKLEELLAKLMRMLEFAEGFPAGSNPEVMRALWMTEIGSPHSPSAGPCRGVGDPPVARPHRGFDDRGTGDRGFGR